MYNYNGKLNERAKQMRKNMTPQANKLWYQFLNDYEIRFRRQRIIDNYIADFYCSKAKLVVEIDGSHHFEEETVEYDKERTGFFNSLGIKVLRIANTDINTNFDAACKLIISEVKKRLR